MGKFQPCCGQTLQTGVKIIAVVNLIYTIGLIIAEVIMVYSEGIKGVESLNPEFSNPALSGVGELGSNKTNLITSAPDESKSKQTLIFSVPALDLIVSIIWLTSWVIDIVISVLLYHAAIHKNIRNCLIWFYFRCSALVFRIIFLIIYMLAGLSLLSKIPVIILFVIRIYSLWVVNLYINELREEKRQNRTGGLNDTEFNVGSEGMVVNFQTKEGGITNPGFSKS